MPRPVSYDYNKRTGILSGAQRKREGESNLANQEQKSICREIGARTGGDIYIGVVGPVRSGKSTFIKRFMEQLVLTLLYRREYRSMENIAAEYGVSRDTIADNIHWVERALLNANLLQNSVTCVYKTN